MRKRRSVITLLMILAACAPQNTTTNLTPEAWQADLQHLAGALPRLHVNAFHTVSPDTFAQEVARLNDAIPKMRDEEVINGLMRVVALVGDGHTHLDLPPTSPRYQLELHWFGEELRVIGAAHPYHAAVGARVLGIGTTPLRDLMERITQLVPRGETEGRTRFTATLQLTSSEVLLGLGVITDPENAPFVLEDAAGERTTMTLSPTELGDFSTWRMVAGENPPLYLRRLMEPWWTEFLPDAHTVYFSFTHYPREREFRERAAALAQLLDESQAQRLVIDLRRNGGGDLLRFRRLLLPVIEARPAINREGGLFVITGPGTFSAAGVNALDMRHHAHAILVGEPAGVRPNHYGDHGEFRLPNSNLRVSYATRFHRLDAETDSAIIPDKHIEPTWEEFRAGRDPALEWILSYKQ